MKTRSRPCAFLVAAILSVLAAFPSTVRAVDLDFTAVVAHLDANLDAYDNELYVEIRDATGTLFTYRAGGFGPATRIGIASATKWPSGCVLLALDDAEALDRLTPAGELLPILANNGLGHLTATDGFTMTHGLTGTDFEILPTVTLAQSVNLIATRNDLTYPTGTTLDYEGKGMQIAGRMAEVATGMDWQAIADTYLFGPLGISTATYDRFDNNPAVAGGLQISPQDYLRILQMIFQEGVFEGRQILSPASIETLWVNWTAGLPIAHTPWPDTPERYPYGNNPTYAWGAWVLADNPRTGLVEELCSPGAWGTFPWIDRRRGLYGIFYTDVPTGSQAAVVETIAALELIREIWDAAHAVPWQDFLTHADGTRTVPWLGRVDDRAFPWIEHATLGGLGYAGPDEAGGWWWSEAAALGWLYTGRDLFPYLYRADPAGWLFYDRGSRYPRWFYDFAAGAWVSVEG